MNEFEFNLDQPVRLVGSAETGKVVARAEYLHGENQFYVRYRAGDGRLTEAWWGASALEAA